MTTQTMGDNTGVLIVARPAIDDPYTSKLEDPHVTLLWFGDTADLSHDLLPAISAHCAEVAGEFAPFEADVSGVALLGPDPASVLLLESVELVLLRSLLAQSGEVQQAWEQAQQFPAVVYHLTTSYDGELPKDPPSTVRFDSIALWVAGQRTDFPFGEIRPMTSGACLIPPISCLADLSSGLHYADENPSARWYVTKRATALGAACRIPEQWMVPA